MKTRFRYTQTVVVGGAVTGRRIVTVKHDYTGAGPMSYEAREDAYYRQNGARPITRRQERQLDRMLMRAHHKAAR